MRTLYASLHLAGSRRVLECARAAAEITGSVRKWIELVINYLASHKWNRSWRRQRKHSWKHQKAKPTNAVALEFIAHYLDRIDDHLERIANAVEKGDASETMNIERAIASAKTTL